MTETSEQETLTDDDVDDGERLVWVVTGNYAADPHPHVLGVYDNEDAAREHEKAIRDSIKPSEPVAWGHTEVEVNSEPLRERRSRVDD